MLYFHNTFECIRKSATYTQQKAWGLPPGPLARGSAPAGARPQTLPNACYYYTPNLWHLLYINRWNTGSYRCSGGIHTINVIWWYLNPVNTLE